MIAGGAGTRPTVSRVGHQAVAAAEGARAHPPAKHFHTTDMLVSGVIQTREVDRATGRSGRNLQNIRKAVDSLRANRAEDLAGITLVSDGNTIYQARSPDQVVDLLQGGHGVFGIAIGGRIHRDQE